MDFDNELFDEYKRLKEILLKDQDILSLIEERNILNEQLRSLDQYTNEYKELKIKYDHVTKSLLSNETYTLFKELEREVNLFVMYCNTKLKELFGLDEKGCAK